VMPLRTTVSSSTARQISQPCVPVGSLRNLRLKADTSILLLMNESRSFSRKFSRKIRHEKMASTSNVGKPTMLWAVPRSISTAFFRAMENHPNTRVYLEPYSKAYYFGPERVSSRYADQPVQEECTFLSVKNTLESAGSASPDKQVFVKDMAYYLYGNKYEPKELLPSGYRHTFLVRDPHKTVKSLYKMSINTQLTGWDSFDEHEIGFKELWSLYELIQTIEDEPPIVIDADDLLQQPEDYFKAYCSRIGLPYEPSMLKWDAARDSIAAKDEWAGWFEGVLGTTSFVKPLARKRQPSIDLPDYVMLSIERNLPYYHNFLAVKTRLEDIAED
uniref:Sulfotransfer_1 domain-containing protein n=2 Tax=Macrostomum lignano TaxID=282301 RepID=A0A1I8GSR1_9PLAT